MEDAQKRSATWKRRDKGMGAWQRLWRWVWQTIQAQLTQGLSHAQAARAVAYGLTLGIFPILGSTTLLTLVVGVPLKLNQPILQLFKTLASPLQWALILGFYRVGEWLFQVPPVSLSIPVMLREFGEAPLPFFAKYGMTALYGVAVWILVAPLLIWALAWVAAPIIGRLARGVRQKRHSRCRVA